MVTDRYRSGYDFWLEHSGVKMGYLVADMDGGLKAWQSGLAPMLTQQINQSGFGYQALPQEIDSPISFEDWSGGAGFTDASATVRTRYNYSQGVDASWGRRLYLSPLLQALTEDDATAIGAAPDFFSRTSDGVFCGAGRYIYEFVSPNWTQRYDAGAATGITGPVVDFNGTQFAPFGDSTAYAYSTDGITWTASTLADPNAQFFTVRGESSGSAVIWKISSTGALKNNTSGINGGAAWSAAVQVGGTGETVNGLVVSDNDLVIFKTDGIYTYDGTTLSKVWDGGRLMYRSNNGSHPTIFSNNRIYTTYGDTLLEYDNAANTERDRVRFVWPATSGFGNGELNGRISAIAADITHIYFALTNSDSNVYAMKGQPDTGFHTVAYLGANACDAMLVVGAGDVHANNPSWLFGYGTAADYFINVRVGLRPESDANYRFDTAGGFIFGPWDDGGAAAFTKFLNAGRLVLEGATAARTCALSYGTDGATATTSFLTASSNGASSAEVSALVEFSRVRYRLDLVTDVNTASPRLVSAVFNTTPNPPRKRVWQPVVEIADDLPLRGGGVARFSSTQMEQHLFDAVKEKVTLYDRRGRTYTTRVISIDGVGMRVAQNTDADLYRVLMAEIAEIAATGDILIWGTDAYDSGKRWGPD